VIFAAIFSQNNQPAEALVVVIAGTAMFDGAGKTLQCCTLCGIHRHMA